MSRYQKRKLKIFGGNATPDLAQEIADNAGVGLGEIELGRFKDGEVRVVVKESVRGSDVFVIQSTCSPVNENLMELLVILDALKRASARRINVVVPFYGYARQDRKTRGREPISAKLVANLLTTAGADRVVTMDLHAGQIQGFFDIPVDHLTGIPILAEYFEEKGLRDVVVVSPDAGGVARARRMADILNCPIAFVDKRRPKPNVSEVMNVIGEVEGRTAILVDDIIDTAGTITQGAAALRDRGAEAVYACCTHPVFSPPARERLSKAPLKEIVVSNSIPLKNDGELDNLRVLSIAPLLAEVIIRINAELSVSKLF